MIRFPLTAVVGLPCMDQTCTSVPAFPTVPCSSLPKARLHDERAWLDSCHRSLRPPQVIFRKEPGHKMSAMGWLNAQPNTSCFKEAGHTTSAMGWLKESPNDSCCREAGHTTSAMGWLNAQPSDSFCRETGHTTSAMFWLKECPNRSCCREAGHTTPTIGWLKKDPNVSCCREAGHDTASTAVSTLNISHLSPTGQIIDRKLASGQCLTQVTP
ncbi:unnamed protein product [Ectocarpus fasciculatus]